MDIDARRESGVADLHAFDFVLNQETAPAAMHRGNIRLRDAQSEAVPVERPCRSPARHAPRGEEFAVRPTIPRDQPGRLRLGMRPDREVRQNPRPLATLLAIGAPSGSPGKGLLCSTARLESHSPQERRRLRADTRSRCKARHTPNRTQQEAPTFCGVLQSPYGRFIE